MKQPVAPTFLRPVAIALCGLALLRPAAASAHEDRSPWWPTAVFTQLGVAENANAAVLGVLWDWSWRRDVGWGRVTGYWEVSFGRWASDAGGSSAHAWVTQVGITPVLRLYTGGGDTGWYGELGIGANLLLPIYRSEDKRFSTKFNFGDHLAAGWRFGDRGEHDVALRIQHFSNAGIKDPNPGEDFLQLRYSRRF